jgi:hypothetical protein
MLHFAIAALQIRSHAADARDGGELVNLAARRMFNFNVCM